MINIQMIAVMGLAITATSGASYMLGNANGKAKVRAEWDQAVLDAEAQAAALEQEAAEAAEAFTEQAGITASGIESVDAQIQIEREMRAAEAAQLKRDVTNAINNLEVGDCGLEPMPSGVQFGLERLSASFGDSGKADSLAGSPDQ